MARYLLALLVVLFAARAAEAYPQFQLSKDQTCQSCHISPAGGGLLAEQGLNTADQMSQLGTNPDFMYAKLPLPSWLMLGGDLRGAGGFLQAPARNAVAFPMQFDVYASAAYQNFRLYVTAGLPPETYDAQLNQGINPPWSREHYLMWQSNPGETEGFYARVGRFMPVFGLRFAEHDDYNRRYGGTPLYGETYGLGTGYVSGKYEAHVTGFIRDPLIDTVLHDNGVAAYGEYRLDEQTSVGVEGMYTVSKDSVSVNDRKLRGGVTAKHYFKCPDLLVQGEAQVVDQIVPGGNTDGSSTYTYQMVGYLLASWFPAEHFMVDGGLGYYNENLRLHGPYRNAFDLNIHWFTTSHLETLLISRYEPISLSTSDPSGAYAMLMLHYRL